MRAKKSREFILEVDEVFIVRRWQRPFAGWCAACGRQVRMVTPDEAASILRVSSRLIYRRVEDDSLHFMETAEGRLLICSNSLGNE